METRVTIVSAYNYSRLRVSTDIDDASDTGQFCPRTDSHEYKLVVSSESSIWGSVDWRPESLLYRHTIAVGCGFHRH